MRLNAHLRSLSKCLSSKGLDGQGAVTLADRHLVGERSQQVHGSTIVAELRVLVAACDVDKQRSTPLEIVRHFVAPMTELCRELGMQPIRRDRFLIERFKDDDYDLTPPNLAVIDDEVAGAALIWGAMPRPSSTNLATGRTQNVEAKLDDITILA